MDATQEQHGHEDIAKHVRTYIMVFIALACLTAIVPFAFRSPAGAAIHRRARRVCAGSMGTTTRRATSGVRAPVSTGLASARPMAAMTSAGGASALGGAKCLMDQPVGWRWSTPKVSSRGTTPARTSCAT